MTSKITYVGNIYGAPGPWEIKGLFQAGTAQTVGKGDFLERNGSSPPEFIPVSTDKSLSAELAIAACKIESGDLAGWHKVIVPREGDIFEMPLDAASSAVRPGDDVFISGAQEVTLSGSNAIGKVIDDSHLPEQGFQSQDASYDRGTSARSRNAIRFTITKSISYLSALQG